jgi:hypothetical protein
VSPSDLEEYIAQRPLPTMRLTLSSGDQLIIGEEDTPILEGLTLVLRGRTVSGRVTSHPRLVSVPNIVLVEPVDRPAGTRRRRSR